MLFYTRQHDRVGRWKLGQSSERQEPRGRGGGALDLDFSHAKNFLCDDDHQAHTQRHKGNSNNGDVSFERKFTCKPTPAHATRLVGDRVMRL